MMSFVHIRSADFNFSTFHYALEVESLSITQGGKFVALKVYLRLWREYVLLKSGCGPRY